jgi:hypothetical protein
MSNVRSSRFPRFIVVGAVATLVAILNALSANAHELWIETASVADSGKEYQACVCWGHSGTRRRRERIVLDPTHPLTVAKSDVLWTIPTLGANPGTLVAAHPLIQCSVPREPIATGFHSRSIPAS